MALADSMPRSWSIAGLHGTNSRRLPMKLTDTVGDITYKLARFPASVTPSTLAPTYTTAKSFNVAQRFERACRYIVTRSARAQACNAYFRALGRSAGRPAARQYTLSDLLAWEIVFYFWQPISRIGPVPTSGPFLGLKGTLIKATPETRFAEIAIAEYSLVTATNLAAVVVHELAHIAGAPGATDAQRSQGRALRRADPVSYRRLVAAQAALRPCLLGQMFNPDVLGALHDLEDSDRAVRRVIA
ncbi:MAG: hypothetical protein MUC89_20300 [Acetobacteraceae bacterium]|jgi:hypothetical protein|nr:hypothetical protein [Acetobacteraceae bacterium]